MSEKHTREEILTALRNLEEFLGEYLKSEDCNADYAYLISKSTQAEESIRRWCADNDFDEKTVAPIFTELIERAQSEADVEITYMSKANGCVLFAFEIGECEEQIDVDSAFDSDLLELDNFGDVLADIIDNDNEFCLERDRKTGHVESFSMYINLSYEIVNFVVSDEWMERTITELIVDQPNKTSQNRTCNY